MGALAIVVGLDVGEQLPAGLFAGLEPGPVDQLHHIILVPQAPYSMAPKIAKSVTFQTTSSVKCIAIRGSNNMSAAIPQGAILQIRPRRPPPLSVFPVKAVPPRADEHRHLSRQGAFCSAWISRDACTEVSLVSISDDSLL